MHVNCYVLCHYLLGLHSIQAAEVNEYR